jgi:hypothetical protein
MRAAVLPKLRIAAGLLLAVLLSVVGCHVLRWRNPASPEAGNQNHTLNSAAVLDAPLTSRLCGILCQKCFTPIAIPPETSPTKTKLRARFPLVTCNQELLLVCHCSLLSGRIG